MTTATDANLASLAFHGEFLVSSQFTLVRFLRNSNNNIPNIQISGRPVNHVISHANKDASEGNRHFKITKVKDDDAVHLWM